MKNSLLGRYVTAVYTANNRGQRSSALPAFGPQGDAPQPIIAPGTGAAAMPPGSRRGSDAGNRTPDRGRPRAAGDGLLSQLPPRCRDALRMVHREFCQQVRPRKRGVRWPQRAAARAPGEALASDQRHSETLVAAAAAPAASGSARQHSSAAAQSRSTNRHSRGSCAHPPHADPAPRRCRSVSVRVCL